MNEQAPVLRWPLRLLAAPYGLAVRLRAMLYQRGWLPQQRLPCRVISVGNLTVGGTGKTPIVIWMVNRLLAQGRRVGVLSRGYRRQSDAAMVLVSDGRSVLVGPKEAGDEPHLIATRCPGALVAVGADRHRIGRWVLERFPVDCFILDDGFQHLAIHRDVNLLLVDASDARGLDALLPVGRLREPLSAAARATAVVLTRAEDPAHRRAIIAKLARAGAMRETPIVVRFTVEAVVNLKTQAIEKLERLGRGRVLAFSGIANPSSFPSLLERAGVQVLDHLVFPDHHWYQDQDLQLIQRKAAAAGSEVMLTTEKDADKILRVASSGAEMDHFWAVRLGTEVVEGKERLERLLFGNAEC
jgi:tetraacyldisaccharide 4'-kinase